VSPQLTIEAEEETARQDFVEDRDARNDGRLVTVIELLSPSTKRPGPDRDAYAAKQRDLLASDASLVEIDLSRLGERVMTDAQFASFVDRLVPRPAYLVVVSPFWMRSRPGCGYHAFPIRLRDSLPCIDIPLTPELAEVSMDLQYVFNRSYDLGPYRRAERTTAGRSRRPWRRTTRPGRSNCFSSKASWTRWADVARTSLSRVPSSC
jgi:hypothetical protein